MAATGPLGTAEAIVDSLVQQGATLAYHDDDYSSLGEFARSRDPSIAEHVKKILAQ